MQVLNGFVKIHRKLLQWGWYQDNIVKGVFVHILLTANFKDQFWMGRVIKKGQVVIGTQKMADELGFTREQVRRAINKLKSTNEITTETTNKYTIITVVNWNEYQYLDDEDTTNKTTSTSTNEQPTNNQQTTNKQPQRKNDKNIKNDKEGREVTRAYACEDDDTTDCESSDYSVPHVWGGTLGKNVLVMSDEQLDDLCERMSIDVLHKYIDKITLFILSEGKNVRNHYGTICRWYEEDYGGKEND